MVPRGPEGGVYAKRGVHCPCPEGLRRPARQRGGMEMHLCPCSAAVCPLLYQSSFLEKSL